MYQFESAGNARIIIRATTNVNLLGVAYAPDDVVATFENAFFELSFINNNKSVTQSPITLLNYNVMNLDSLIIEAKNLSYSHYNFMATNRFLDQNILIPMKETVVSDSSGVAFFTRIPVNTKPVFIKNNLIQNITGYTIDYETGQITGLGNTVTYTTFYYYQEVSLISYDLEKVETPYFKIEITGENNVNGASRHLFIEIPLASITIQPKLSFSQNNLATTELSFKIINGKAKVIYY
jgi:hypothetical protein